MIDDSLKMLQGVKIVYGFGLYVGDVNWYGLFGMGPVFVWCLPFTNLEGKLTRWYYFHGCLNLYMYMYEHGNRAYV